MSDPKAEQVSNVYDYIVIGGGPGGSTVASLLAEGGKSVLVLEGARFPRFSVGEIIAPTGLWRIWHRLGLDAETLDKYFIRKYFGIFHAPDGTAFTFIQDVHPHDPRCKSWVYTFERAVYDNLLLEAARARGVKALEEAWVEDIFTNATGRVCGVKFTYQGQVYEVRCKLVIDASGRSHILANKLGLRLELRQLKSFSTFAHWEGVRREEGNAEGDVHIIFDKDMWYWYAPLKGPKTSLGIVANRDSELWAEYQANPEQFYDRYIRKAPFIAERLENAHRVTGFRLPVRGSNNSILEGYHYSTPHLVGDGWALIGDAGGFVDPILSAGLYVAQNSAEWLATEILKADIEGDLSTERLSRYEARYVREIADLWGHLQKLAIDDFNPAFMNDLLNRACTDKAFANLLVDTFIAYDPVAMQVFGETVGPTFTPVEGPVHPAIVPR